MKKNLTFAVVLIFLLGALPVQSADAQITGPLRKLATHVLEKTEWYHSVRIAVSRTITDLFTPDDKQLEDCISLTEKKNFAEASGYCIQAAKQGHVEAQNILGLMYEQGSGVAQDYVKALYWYRNAAQQGNVWAQLNLSRMYATGKGVAQDFTRARYWKNKADERGY